MGDTEILISRYTIRGITRVGELEKNKMKKWIKKLEEKKVIGAMRNAVASYNRIQSDHAAFGKLDILLEREGVDLESVLDNTALHMFMSNYPDRAVQLYSYGENGDLKEAVEGIMIASVELFGAGKRSIDGGQVRYDWTGDCLGDGIGFCILVQPEATGCKLVQKEVPVAAVPAKPATTKKVWEVECDEPEEVAA